jgi:hypothetical protein
MGLTYNYRIIRRFKMRNKKMGLKQRFKDMSKRQKIMCSVLLTVLLIAGVSATWIFSYNRSFTGQVISDGEFSVTGELSDFELDVTNGAGVYNSSLELFNGNGEVPFTVSELTITKINTDPSCTNYEEDCTVEFYDATTGLELMNGSNFTLPIGNSAYYFETSCKARSCPQNISYTLQIQALE